jgi:DNA replication protein DnaC
VRIPLLILKNRGNKKIYKDYMTTSNIGKIFGKNYQHASLEDFKLKEGRPFSGLALHINRNLAKIKDQLKDNSVLINAPHGSGKTHFAAALSRDLEIDPHYLRFSDLIRDCEKRHYRGDNFRIHLHGICNARFLVLDELGNSKYEINSPLFKEIIVQVLRERHWYGKPTLFLSPLRHKDMSEIYKDTFFENVNIDMYSTE